ncbi:signal transduction histidine kinase [Clostridium sp. CAG:524]|nr:signal transduction histidine kinase [Clostridium sp. CAG:524]
MNHIEINYIFNSIVIIPIMIYIIFFHIKDEINKLHNNVTLELTILLVYFLCLYVFIRVFKIEYIYYITLPIILSFIFDKYKLNIFLSIINIFMTLYLLDINIFYLLSYYIILFTLYFIIKNKKDFISTYTILNIIYMFLLDNYNIIFLISIYLIYNLIILLKKRMKLYYTLEDIENNKLIKTSIFKVTHEIKNPLAVIKGYLSIFDPYDSDKCLKYKNILEIEVENALNVLKDFSSINHLDIKKNNINYYDLLMEAKETILPFFNDKNIKLNINSPRELFVNADYNRMKQVLINILKNSTEALSDNGKIDIKSYIENNKLITIIKDNGHGMDKETIDNLFTPFYSKKSFGTGLGLCLSKEIIELHNGTIKYTSKLNLYTEVKIVIPVY